MLVMVSLVENAYVPSGTEVPWAMALAGPAAHRRRLAAAMTAAAPTYRAILERDPAREPATPRRV